MKYRDYIPVKKHWFDMYIRHFNKKYWEPRLRVPIGEIKIDKTLFDFQNEVSRSAVLQMVLNFDIDLWMPITVNQQNYLLDGQHRLEVARQLGLNYIDVVIEDRELLETG